MARTFEPTWCDLNWFRFGFNGNKADSRPPPARTSQFGTRTAANRVGEGHGGAMEYVTSISWGIDQLETHISTVGEHFAPLWNPEGTRMHPPVNENRYNEN